MRLLRDAPNGRMDCRRRYRHDRRHVRRRDDYCTFIPSLYMGMQ